jgi:hypothetical protein
MVSRKKTPSADRSRGGPGSSHQDRVQGENAHAHAGTKPDQPTNTVFSGVSGGGGERDIHHAHDPERKGRPAPRRGVIPTGTIKDNAEERAEGAAD